MTVAFEGACLVCQEAYIRTARLCPLYIPRFQYKSFPPKQVSEAVRLKPADPQAALAAFKQAKEWEGKLAQLQVLTFSRSGCFCVCVVCVCVCVCNTMDQSSITISPNKPPHMAHTPTPPKKKHTQHAKHTGAPRHPRRRARALPVDHHLCVLFFV